jgi:hypothetical protein
MRKKQKTTNAKKVTQATTRADFHDHVLLQVADDP